MAAKIAEKNDHLYPNLKSKGKISIDIFYFYPKEVFNEVV